MQLRPYQEKALQHFKNSKSRSVLLVAPTGAGKGTMAASIMRSYAHQGLRSLFLVHRREIVHDIAARLKRHGVHPAQTLYSDSPARVISIQSALRSHIQPVDLIVIDEAHHYAADEWKSVMDRIKTKRIVGFTATPQRADGRSLGDMFEELVDVVSYSNLLKQGHLVPCRVLRPKAAISKSQLALEPAEAYLKYGRGEPGIIFVRRIKDAEDVANILRAQGIRAASISSGTRKQLRDATMQRLHNRQLDVVVNVGILTEGTDIPHIRTLILARPCTHDSTYVQIVGRVLRPSPGKTISTVIDLVGASFYHGLPNQDRIYTLDGAGMQPAERDARSGPSGEHTEVEIDVLGLDLVEIKAGAFNPPIPVPVKPVPDPAVVAARLAAKEEQERRKLLRELEERAAIAQGGVKKGQTIYSKHGTTKGFLFEDKGFWCLGWTQGKLEPDAPQHVGTKKRIGLATKDKVLAEYLLDFFREHGPEALKTEILKHKRSAMTLYKSNESTLWALRKWNDDRTKQITIKLSTRDRKEAEQVRELFLKGKEFEARKLISNFNDRNEKLASERRAETVRRNHQRRRERLRLVK